MLGWGRLRVGPAAYSTGNGDHGRSNAVPRHQNLGLDCRLGFLGVTTPLTIVSTITDKMAGFVYVALAAIYMLLTGKAKAAIVFTGRVGGHHPTTGIPGKDFSCFSKWARLYHHSVFLVRKFLEHLLPFRGKISAANISRLHCHRTVGWPIQSPCSGPLPK